MQTIQNQVEKKPQVHYLKDYQKPDFKILSVDLTFEIHETQTVVTTQLEFEKESSSKTTSLVLDGERLKLMSVELNNQLLNEKQYQITDTSLTIFNVPNKFKLKTVVTINPSANTYLEGLYKSKNTFCTQNEPQGFRKITYFLDRPDVMSIFTTKIIADKKSYPTLLSNGNKIESVDLPSGKHSVTWHDPFKKPAYLFALVAGNLACIEDQFIRKSKKPVKLQIFCDYGTESKCTFAMDALKKSMKWDEEVYNLEYDLDIFMIAAVEAFNAGAMENKGLNIFNISCVLADKASSTDDNFIRVEKVIAHEYFHNWTGDRVTVRDWFQLTLKEGLTVFRDQEFTSDLHSRPVHRIENVLALRQTQFPEDNGPTAHPIRPSSYIEMNNFYTTTVYEKGSEIIRMVQTLIGKEAFFKGMAKYFELYDGKAVTCDDFIHAMELGSNRDLKQFRRWYEQKGTPHLRVDFEYHPDQKTFTINTTQSNAKEGAQAAPLHFPLKLALLGPDGKEYPTEKMIEIKEKNQSFVFKNIPHKPIVSLNRDFSAPITIESPLRQDDYIFLMGHDSNEFNRWEAAQKISIELMLGLVDQNKKDTHWQLNPNYLKAFGLLLADDKIDPAFKALSLILPSENLMAQEQKVIEFDHNYAVRTKVKKELALAHEALFLKIYNQLNVSKAYCVQAKDIGQRKLKNICLSYLASLETKAYNQLCLKQFEAADNMTDSFGALSALNYVDCPERALAMDQFYKRWHKDPLVIVKWLSLQAASPIKGALARVQNLVKDPVFDYKIPNISRAVIGSFVDNHIHYHALDGSGYTFVEEQIATLDAINPYTAARLSAAFRSFSKLDAERHKKMKASLENLLNKKGLSKNAYEMISKSLHNQ